MALRHIVMFAAVSLVKLLSASQSDAVQPLLTLTLTLLHSSVFLSLFYLPCFVGIFDVWTIVYLHWTLFIRNLYRFTIDTRWTLYGVKSSIKEQSIEQCWTMTMKSECVCRVLFARHILHSATIESIKLRQTSTMHKFYRYIDIQRSRKWLSFFSFNEVQVVNILTSTRKFPQKWFWFEIRSRSAPKKTHTLRTKSRENKYASQTGQRSKIGRFYSSVEKFPLGEVKNIRMHCLLIYAICRRSLFHLTRSQLNTMVVLSFSLLFWLDFVRIIYINEEILLDANV